MMKHLTTHMCIDMHYTPANNVFAFYLMHGLKAKHEYEKTAQEMQEKAAQQGYCPECTDCLVRWYLRSCQQVFDDLSRGQKPNQNYPRISLPPCCNPEVN